MVSDIRKWVSRELGYPTSGAKPSERAVKLFESAAKIPAGPELSVYKSSGDFKPVAVITPRNLSTPETAAPVVQKEVPQEPAPAKEPDILDVMKMAKELGAAEVEYKGMKIKY